jgi:hypothetical protein
VERNEGEGHHILLLFDNPRTARHDNRVRGFLQTILPPDPNSPERLPPNEAAGGSSPRPHAI